MQMRPFWIGTKSNMLNLQIANKKNYPAARYWVRPINRHSKWRVGRDAKKLLFENMYVCVCVFKQLFCKFPVIIDRWRCGSSGWLNIIGYLLENQHSNHISNFLISISYNLHVYLHHLLCAARMYVCVCVCATTDFIENYRERTKAMAEISQGLSGMG